MHQTDYHELLRHIDPAELTYSEWTEVGMALKQEGLTAADWEVWSASDARHKPGECYTKWQSFNGTGTPVTGGTLVHLAKRSGWQPAQDGGALEWDATINDDMTIIDPTWVEDERVEAPSDSEWNPKQELLDYLRTLFASDDYVGYVTQSFEADGRRLPTRGVFAKTAGQLMEDLSRNTPIEEAIGSYDPEVGAWIRFNPLDGSGCKDVNVTDHRFALVECDNISVERQHAILRELELPIACLVYSGGKSLHAITRIEASNKEEYRKRVDYLYKVCQANGLTLDTQNKNPSRLSRMPGVTRNGQKQHLIATNIGKASWHEWQEWIEAVNDDLPDPESLTSVWDNLPDLAPPLINGVLRQGHKMLLAGPSKAGKSFLLIQLTIALAEGSQWLRWTCTRGKVLYVNLELDRASALHRFKDVYEAMGIPPTHIDNIDIWNLRGRAAPLDKLTPKLIRRAQKQGYIAIIIDPIYKVITGDENSASEMAAFANNFDRIATELGSAVIYCHHHSKGLQGAKRAMDRASGSGVFARDPDALLDLLELEMPDKVRTHIINQAKAEAMTQAIRTLAPRYYNGIGDGERQDMLAMERHLHKALSADQLHAAMADIQAAETKARIKTGWRMEGTLREYATFEPLDFFFEYPTHQLDRMATLATLDPETEKAPWQRAMDRRKNPEEKKESRQNELEIAYSGLELEGQEVITLRQLAEEMDVTTRTVRNRIKEHGGFVVESQGDGLPSIVSRSDDPGK